MVAIFGEYIKGAAAISVAKWLNKRLESQKASTRKDQKPFFLMFHSRTAHFPFVIQNATEEEDPTNMRRISYMMQESRVVKIQTKQCPGMAGGQVNQGVSHRNRDPLQIRVDEEGDKVVDVWKATYREAVQRMDGDLSPFLKNYG